MRPNSQIRMITGLTTTLRRTSLAAAMIAMSACGPLSANLSGNDPGKETIYALDGVKLISTSIDSGSDPRTYQQKSYLISSSDRLLMRFESLMAASTKILSTKPVRIRIFATNEAEYTKALSSLRVCPVLKNWWIAAATWQTAHPFKDGEWTPGGDIELDDCVQAEAPTTSAAPASAADANPSPSTPPATFAANPCSEAGAICFDVSAWYNNYVVQRSINYGVALISYDGKPVQIYGDSAGSKGPRIHWSETTTTTTFP